MQVGISYSRMDKLATQLKKMMVMMLEALAEAPKNSTLMTKMAQLTWAVQVWQTCKHGSILTKRHSVKW